ncbi:MAG: RCC1 domain-containing protein [Gemmatimonadota bacterium]
MAKAAGAAVLGLAMIAACGRQDPVGPRPEGPEGDPDGSLRAVTLAAIECTVSEAERSMSCGSATADLLPAAIVGGQHRFVRLTSSAVVTVGNMLSANVTVQNLTLLPMATSNGTTPDPNGVRVFFHTGPTNGVTVANEDGTGTFTGTNQPFFQYSGAELGADGILEQGEVSAPTSWQFDLSGCTTGPPCTFSFTVFVSAITPDESPSARTVSLTQITAGGDHACGIGDDTKTYCWGLDNHGQLGQGGPVPGTDRTTPRPVNTTQVFTEITAGSTHTCALTSAGAAFCWGEGTNGRLGNGGTTDQSSPVAVSGGLTFKEISAGGSHTCAILTTGGAYCWGSDLTGQLGNGATAGDQTTPSAVEGGLTFDEISAGNLHTCAVSSTNDGYCWGSDLTGQLGNGAGLTVEQTSPSAVDQSVSGTFSHIDAGFDHTCGIATAGPAYCWGRDLEGQLGNGGATVVQETPDAVVQSTSGNFDEISTGAAYTCGIATAGPAYCWGSDLNGRLGNGATAGNQATPSLVAGGLTLAQLVAGTRHVCARESGGQGYCWGDDGFGQLGDGQPATESNAPAFIAATTN